MTWFSDIVEKRAFKRRLAQAEARNQQVTALGKAAMAFLHPQLRGSDAVLEKRLTEFSWSSDGMLLNDTWLSVVMGFTAGVLDGLHQRRIESNGEPYQEKLVEVALIALTAASLDWLKGVAEEVEQAMQFHTIHFDEPARPMGLIWLPRLQGCELFREAQKLGGTYVFETMDGATDPRGLAWLLAKLDAKVQFG